MAEANEAEPNERAAPSPRRPRRKHVISLCCAQSVHRVVEEVARNLEGLGFTTTVVTGAEARAALLGSRTDSEQPTIHVVCVQGSMQERLLKPLRQALATHGGPNHHLFVAVLDLGVPLAMVGQIRRFAESLERPASGSHAAAIAVGREPSAHHDLEQSPTRSYPTVAQVVERGGTKPPAAPEGEGLPRRTRPLGVRPPVAKIGPTSKYQAVTASNAALPPETGVRKRRRARSRMSPAAQRRAPDERVLGLPEQEQSRQPVPPRVQPPPAPQPPPPPAPASASQPPPPPAPGELARRRTMTPGGPTPPPPPPTKTPSSTSLPAASESPASARRTPGEPIGERQTSPYLRRVEDKPPEPGAAAGQDPEASQSPAAGQTPAEADRPVPRPDGAFRFSPPGVKAAEPRRPGVSGSTVALSEVLGDSADRTMVQGVLAEVPRTASTLRLDEPPFADGAKPRGRDGGSEDDEPVEPTMILAAPRGAVIEVDEEELEPSARGKVRPVPPASIVGASPLPPAATGTTVVGPPPKPTPEALAELERGRREAAGAAGFDPGPRKTIGYLQRGEAEPSEGARSLGSESSRTLAQSTGGASESSGTLVLRARTAVTVDEEELLPDSASTLVQRPRTTGAREPSAGPSGTLVLRAREGEAKPSSESSGTVVLDRRSGGTAKPGSESSGTAVPDRRSGGAAKPGSESSGTAVLERRVPEPPKLGSESSGTMRPRPGGARPASESSGTMRPRLGDAVRAEGPSGTVVQPAPTTPASESEKTLLRSDGSFENSRDLMQKIEASRRPAPAEAAGTKAAAPAPPAAAPGDPQAAFKAGKTVLYSDSSAAPLPEKPTEGGTVVAAPPAGPAPSAAPSAAQAKPSAPAIERDAAGKPSAAPSTEQAKPSAAPSSAEQGGTVVTPKPAPHLVSRESEPDAPLLTGRSPSGRKVPQSAVPTERHPLAEAEPDGKPSRRGRGRKREIPRSSDERPSPRSGVLEPSAPSTREQPRPRAAAARPRTKSTASRYGWLWITLVLLAAGGGWGAYQAGLFGGRSGSTVADASTSQSDPSISAARTSAGEAGAAEAGAGAAEAGAAEAGAAEAGAAEAGVAEAGAAEAGAGAADAGAAAAEAGAAEAGAAEAGAADGDAGTTGPTPKADAGDEDSTTGAPEPAADSAGAPDQPSETRGPDQPSADDGPPDEPPTTGGAPDTPPTTGGDPEPIPGDGPRLSADEQKLQPAVDQRRLFMLKTLYTTRRQGEETSFGGAWQRCAKLEVDGITRWRLPHRREMKLINAVLNLPSGVYWTRTVPEDDKSSAYVLDTNDGSLALFQKSEPIGDVVCVRERDFPEK